MAQFALPLSIGGEAGGRIVVGTSNQAVLSAFQNAQSWPFRTAVLSGPPRSGKSLLARYFVEATGGDTIDDADEFAEDELFHRWNQAQSSGRALLLVRSRAEAWSIRLPDLASRLGAALALEISPPDDAMLDGLLQAHAQRRGLALGEGAVTWLVPRIERDYAAVEALAGEIDRLSLERKAPVTISLLRDALDPGGGARQPRLL